MAAKVSHRPLAHERPGLLEPLSLPGLPVVSLRQRLLQPPIVGLDARRAARASSGQRPLQRADDQQGTDATPA